MSQRSPLRKLLLDMTPLIDMIMILLFGVMVYSVEISRTTLEDAEKTSKENQQQREQAEADQRKLRDVHARADYLADLKEQNASRIKDLEEELRLSKEKLEELRRQLEQQRTELAGTLATLLGENLKVKDLIEAMKEQDLSRSGTKRLLEILKGADKDPSAAYKALRRIQEMEKVFYFVDIHLDARDRLVLVINGIRQDPHLDVQGLSQPEITRQLANRFQVATFSQVVLFMFSYEGKARVRAMERVVEAIQALRQDYEKNFREKQFRVATLGIVEHAPPQAQGEQGTQDTP